MENISKDILDRLENFLKKNMERDKIYLQYELNRLLLKFIDREKILSLSDIWKREWMVAELRKIMEDRGVIKPIHHLFAETYYKLA